MKLEEIIAWMDGVLKPEWFDDVSNNGLQIARSGGKALIPPPYDRNPAPIPIPPGMRNS